MQTSAPEIVSNRPQAPFVPVTITLKTPTEAANLLAALVAHGTKRDDAEDILTELGIHKFYSGNVTKASRITAKALAVATGLPVPDFSDYFASSEYRNGNAQAAGSAVPASEQPGKGSSRRENAA